MLPRRQELFPLDVVLPLPSLAIAQCPHPLPELALRTAIAWFKYVRRFGISSDLRAMWADTFRRVVRVDSSLPDAPVVVRIIWRHVWGPVSSLIATLASIGWRARHPSVWYSPTHAAYVLDPLASVHAAVDILVQSANHAAWSRAALHFHGSGLE